MAQRSWTYVSDHGRKYNIGIFHGPNTGHVLVYCNLKILIIDFSVLKSKSYAFFLGEEFCELNLNRVENGYIYTFNINKEIDTPHNRARKARERKHWYQSLAFFGFLAICAFAFSAWVLNNGTIRGGVLSDGRKIEVSEQTVADIYLDPSAPEGFRIIYLFNANGNHYQSEVVVLDTLLNNGMPIHNGDQFMVLYDRYDPTINQLVWESPSPNQIQKYLEMAIEKHQEQSPNLPNYMVACQVQVAYEIKGIEGLADFYFQDKAPAENPFHNKTSFLKLIRDFPFKNQEGEKCW